MKFSSYPIAIVKAALLVGAVHCSISRVAAEVWTQTGVGPFTWNDGANWNPATVPNATSATAGFTTAGGPATQDVTLDVPITLGALDLTNSATSYTISNGAGGSFTFNNGASVSAISMNAGTLPQTISANITVGAVGLKITQGSTSLFTLNGLIDNGGFPLTISSSGPTAVPNTISGNGSLNKRGSGITLTLSGANSYSGGTYFGEAGQGGSNVGTIALSGGNDRLLNTSVVYFHPVGYVGNNVASNTYTSTLDVGSTSQTLSTIRLPGAGVGVAEAPTGAAVTITGTGGTLTLNGDHLYVGIATLSGTTTPAVTHNVNMSTLSNFVFNNSAKDIAVHLSGIVRVNSATAQVATLTLAQNNTIDAANILVSDRGPGGGAGGGQSTLVFGNGTNIVNIGSSPSSGRFSIGYSSRSNAIVTLPSGGNLTLRGFGGGSTPLPELFIGWVNNSGTTAFTDTVNWSAGTVNAVVTRMDLGTADTQGAGARAGVITSNFTLGATSGAEGFTVGTLNIGRITGDAATALGGIFTANGVFTMNNAAGTLNATTINLAENTITNDSSSFAKTVTGTLNLTNGTIKATSIQLGAQTGLATVVTPKLNWTNGTIENPTGGDTAINGVPIVLASGTHTINATGSNSISLDSASVISGAFPITKAGTGTLHVNAPNSYSGTTINGGSLVLNGSATLGDTNGSLTINNAGSMLDLNGTTQTVGNLTGSGGSIVNNMAGAVTFTTSSNASGSYAGVIADNSGSGGTVALTKGGTGMLTLSGSNAFTGPTAVTGGGSTGGITFTAAAPATTGITVDGGSTLNFSNGAPNQLTNLSTLTLGGSGTTTLGFQLGTTAASDLLGTTGTATAMGTIKFNLASLSGFGPGDYTLLTAAGGGLTSSSPLYQVGSAPSGFGYNFSLNTDNAVILQVFSAPSTPGNKYWVGGSNANWNSSDSFGNSMNFADDLAGTTFMAGLPSSHNTVIFSASNANAGNTFNTNLEADFSIRDLIFNNETQSGAISSININPGSTPAKITLTPVNSAQGIDVQTGAPSSINIAAGVLLGGNQTWTVADVSTNLQVSGDLSGSGDLTKVGPGTLRLSGTNAGLGVNISVSGGNLLAMVNENLGTGNITASGGTLDLNGTTQNAADVFIAGNGADGNGALINNGAEQQNALRSLTLTADASVGGASRFDVRANPTGSIDFGGFTLTKMGGNDFRLAGVAVSNPGQIQVQSGRVTVEGATNLGGTSANKITVSSGAALNLFQNDLHTPWAVDLADFSTFANENGTSSWEGPVTFTGTNTVAIDAGTGSTMTLAGVIGGTGTLNKTGPGTLVLTNGGNSYAATQIADGTLGLSSGTAIGAGSVTILGGGINNTSGSPMTLSNNNVQFWNSNFTFVGSNSLDMGTGAVTLGTTPIVTVTANNLTVGGVISGGSGIEKAGAGTLTLTAANQYAGQTYLSAGTLALSGGDDRLPTTSVLNFHPSAYVTGANYVSTLDIGSTSQTLSTLHFPGANGPPGSTTEAPTGAVVTIAGSGGTLKLNGDNLYIGIATNATYTGTLTHNVNMSTLTNFVFDNSTKEVGVQLMGAIRAGNQVATLTMATNNSVTASNLLVGNTSPGGSVGGGSSTLTLGSGANVLTIGSSASAGAINVGFGVRSSASIAMPVGGSVTIRGFNGGSNPLLDFNIGHIFNSTDPRAFTDAVNFSSGTVDALVTNMLIGLAGDVTANATRNGTTNASFSMGAGTVTVDNLTIGSMKLATGTTVGLVGLTSGTAGSLVSNSTFTVGTATAAGTLNATTINVAENLDNGATFVDANDSAAVNGTLALTNGTVRATTIQQPHTVTSIATATPKINWTTGTIENTSGADLAINGVPIVLLTTADHNFNATGSNSITLDAASIISGETFGVTKQGSGTLVFAGVHTYTGATNIVNGLFNVDTTGSIDSSQTINVNTAGSLLANHILTTTLNLDGSATVRADGGAVGASKVETLVMSGTGQLNLKNNDLVVGTGNLLDVRSQIKLGVSGLSNTAAANGITSDMMTASVHGFGYALGDDVNRSPLIGGPGAGGTLSGLIYDADSVLVKFTYRGDADLDGDSDLDDLGYWANSFTGDLGNPVTPSTFWTQGDWDYDGDTDLDDLGYWSSTFTGDLGGGGLSVYAPNASEGAIAALAQMGITAVPEPSGLLLVSLAVLGLSSFSRERRKVR